MCIVLYFSESAPNGLRYLRVGGRGGGLRCRKNSKPEKYSKVAQTPRASGARFVRPHGWQKKETDEKNVIGAEALNTAGKTTPPKNLPILLHDCEQDATTKKTNANENNLALRSADEQEKAIRQTNWLRRKN